MYLGMFLNIYMRFPKKIHTKTAVKQPPTKMKKLLVVIALFLGFESRAQKLSQKILSSKKEFVKTQKNGNQTVVFSNKKFEYTVLASKESLSFWMRPIGTRSKEVLETWSTDHKGKINSFSGKDGTYFYGEYYDKKTKKPLEKKEAEKLKEHFESLNIEATKELTNKL